MSGVLTVAGPEIEKHGLDKNHWLITGKLQLVRGVRPWPGKMLNCDPAEPFSVRTPTNTLAAGRFSRGA